jgi:hypothetical protein
MSSPGGGPSVKLITVSVDSQGNPTVDQASVDLWSTNGDTCKWMSRNIPFVITFAAGSPFAQSSYSGPSASSGSIQSGATGSYKYSVQVGSKILDPMIIIRP